MSLTTIPIDHLPPGHAVHIALFHSVANAAFLHEQLLAGNTDFEYALIDASVVSLTPLLLSSLRSCPERLYHVMMMYEERSG
jgi:EKC/KEOPS complex subunit CGI121/TPRKB